MEEEKQHSVSEKKTKSSKDMLLEENCINPETCKISFHHHNKERLSEQSFGKKNIRGRIFGDDEILGGSDHPIEECVNPLECSIHRDEARE